MHTPQTIPAGLAGTAFATLVRPMGPRVPGIAIAMLDAVTQANGAATGHCTQRRGWHDEG
jgi:hypothetical protein